MDKRLKIALLYFQSKNWVAGTYYVQNLIMSLNTLPDRSKPELDIYCEKESIFESLALQTRYPYMNFVSYSNNQSIWDKVCNRIKMLVNPYGYKNKGAIEIKNPETAAVFPITDLSMLKQTEKAICWIPDFQEHYYPDYFMKKELRLRSLIHKTMIKEKVPIIFSSNDSLNDFKTLYPEASNQSYVMNFAVTHPDYSREDIQLIKKKYNIGEHYFFCANQFWPHKNHLFLFKVFKKYLTHYPTAQLVCSGTLKDFRKKDSRNEYVRSIQEFLEKENLKDNIKILGCISREEQLCLMKNARAIVQPSLFEGWSTVVEDAKCMNKHIFLSNIDVHVEQNPTNVTFFNPNSEDDLLTKMLNSKPSNLISDYSEKVKEYGKNFIGIVEKCINNQK